MLLEKSHLDFEVLDQHIDGIVVSCAERDNQVGVFHSWLDEVVVGGFDEAIVLGENIDDSASTLCNISLNLRQKTNYCEHLIQEK